LPIFIAEGPGPSHFVPSEIFGMLTASSCERRAASLLAAFFAVFMVSAASAQTINLSLNVFYSTPSNVNSGGTWELVAKSSDFGIAGVVADITNISTGQNKAPRATVNLNDPAGFGLFDDHLYPPTETHPAYHELVIGQAPLFPGQPGKEENVFYGVGTLTNGSPDYPGKPAGSNSIGPTFTSLTSPQDIPWATGDAFGDPVWNTAARLANGSFPTNLTPAFFTGGAGQTGQVFTTIGTSTVYGTIVQAPTFTAIVRTNFAPALNSADYNHNGTVDAADYVLWRKQLGSTVTAGTGADGNGDGMVTQADYDLWRSHFGLAMGAGGSLSTGTVPEPASFVLLAGAAILSFTARWRRSNASM
jgi:hypothetical protein